MKWFTCTPKRFTGDHTFFSRDSGLCCRGLQMLGVESRAVMPGPPMAGDDPDLIRTEYANLESSAWWQQWGLTGLILYSWGAPQYTRVARAVRGAGIRLVVNMDTAGLLSPVVSPQLFFGGLYNRCRIYRGAVVGPLEFLLRAARWLFPARLDHARIRHLACADLIGAVSPVAAERLQQYLKYYGREDLAAHVRVTLHPISPCMIYHGHGKQKQIMAVGRWADPVKNVGLLVAGMAAAVKDSPDYICVIIGSGMETVDGEVTRLPASLRSRFKLVGVLKNSDLVDHYNLSQISVCSSYSEGFHTTSAEALCCGCSVVGPRRPSIPNMPFYAGEESGTLAEEYSTDGLARAIQAEMCAWRQGGRDPLQISKNWGERLHADKVAGNILKLVG